MPSPMITFSLADCHLEALLAMTKPGDDIERTLKLLITRAYLQWQKDREEARG